MAMCQFCSGKGKIEDEYCEWELDCVKLTPLPGIDLTSGEYDADAEPPYYALFLRYLDDEEDRSEHGSFPINFCPVCGRQLNVNYPTHYERNTLVMSAKDWVSFQKSLRDPERIKRQKKFFAELDNMEIKENPDGSWEVPDWLFQGRNQSEK